MARSRDEARGVLPSDVTLGWLWETLVDVRHLDEVLRWPPDVFALVERALEASEAYRFVVSPPPGLTLAAAGGPGPRAAAVAWWTWLDGDVDHLPDSVLHWWKVLGHSLDVGMDDLSEGRDWPVTEALLALHAIADDACAGLGSAAAVAPGPGCGFRAAARELLAETGSLSRLARGVLRVLPRCRASSAGISVHSLARHVCVRGPQVEVEWHRMPSRPTGVAAPEAHANLLLLPWPLRVRARDFRPVPYDLPHMDPTEFGFFAFDPEEALDLGLVEAVLRATLDEAGTVDIVMLPESAIEPADIDPLEELLGRYGVWCLVAGVREPPSDGHLGANWVHVGLRQELVWRHARQYKHHRWSLDGRQLRQYHLGGALSPAMRWWEAVTIPARSLQIIDQGAVTFAPLVCEDLARLEPVADLLRSIGPSLVVALLLDGPQLASRWTARYASVLADDPGSAVLTLTCAGMVRRCRPPGCSSSRVVALWKDMSGDLSEIELEDGAEAVLIATYVSTADSPTADGRRHPATTSTLRLAAVQSIHSRRAPSADRPASPVGPPDEPHRSLPTLDEREVSKAGSWAEAVAEAAAAGPDRVTRLLSQATDPEWRTALGLPPPTRLFLQSTEALRAELPDPPTLEGVLEAAGRLRHADDPAALVTGTLLGIALEQRLFAEVQAGRLPAEVLGSPALRAAVS